MVLAYPLRSLHGKETSSGNNLDKCCCQIHFPIKGGLAHPHILANLLEHRIRHYIRCNFRTILDSSCRVQYSGRSADCLKSVGRLWACWNRADNFYAQLGERQCCARSVKSLCDSKSSVSYGDRPFSRSPASPGSCHGMFAARAL